MTATALAMAVAVAATACTGGDPTPGDAADETPRVRAPSTSAPPSPSDGPGATDVPGATDGPGAIDRPASAVTVAVVGDVMLGRRVAVAGAARGDAAAALRPMAARLARADVTIGNLESTLSRGGRPRQGDDSFAAPPEVTEGLAAAGFDVLTLANNHSGDYGRAALRRTVARVRAAGIQPLGAGGTAEAAWAPVVVERSGLRIGLLAFNAIGETFRAGRRSAGAASLSMQPRTGDIVPGELSRLQDRVRRLAARTDVVIVLPHWGDQYTHRPVPDQRAVGRALVDAGATVVVGGHPHWVQDIERHGDGLVVHSLGNFVFDMDFMRQTQEGVVLTMTFRGDRLERADLTPYVIGGDFAPRPARGARARAILRDIRGRGLLPGAAGGD